MKRKWMSFIILMAAFSLVLSCTTKKVVIPAEDVAKPIPPAEKKIEEEVITAQKPSEVTEAEIKEEAGKIVVEEVSFLKDIQFDFDDYSLTDQAKKILEKNASWMKSNPNAKIQIEGHCDERGTNEYNMALGEKRANSAKKYLIKLGVRVSQLYTISYGEEKPLDPGHNEGAWVKNRRDHFVILK